MQVVILGSGSSMGVPAIACGCDVCISINPKNKRTRSSIVIKMPGSNVLVDTSPDLRTQALNNNIIKIDAVIYTHAHADHVAGIDDLRSFNYLRDGPLDVYGFADTLSYLKHSYEYCFSELALSHWYKPRLIPCVVKPGESIVIDGKTIEFYALGHGGAETLGVRIGNFAYSTDFNKIPEESMKYFENLDLWIVDCLKYQPSHGHLSFDEAMELIDRFKPKRAILCHLAHELGYDELTKKIPAHVSVAYDGMIIDV